MIELQTVTTKAKNPSTNEFQDVTWGGINVLSTSGTTNYNNLTNKPTINGVTVQGSLTTGDLLITATDVGALPSGTKYGADFALSIDSQTFVVIAQLKDQDGNNLGQAKTIDLPLETMVVGGSYDDTTQKVILTLKNGQTVEFSVADLVNGLQSEITLNNKLNADLIDDSTSTNKFVTASDKTNWNAKSERLTILTYGTSTWNDFITAYENNAIVYCKAYMTGAQTRLAFMAYIDNDSAPTYVEFQYYRSVSSKNLSNQCDQVIVYKLDNTGTWTTTTRNTDVKFAAGTALSADFASNTLTFNHKNSGVTAGTYDSITVDEKGHVTAGSNYTVSQAEQDAEIAVIANAGAKNLLKFRKDVTSSSAGNVYARMNSDGTISVGLTSGTTATEQLVFTLGAITNYRDRKLILSGCPTGGNYQSGYALYVSNNGSTQQADTGSGATLPIVTGVTSSVVALIVRSGATISSELTFQPMVRDASIVDPTFVPYAKTNRELTVKNESQQSEIDYAVNTGAKNLLDVQHPTTTTRTSYQPLANGGVELSCSNATWTSYTIADIPVEAGKEYIITFLLDESSGTSNFYFFLRDSNSSGTNLATKNYGSTTGKYEASFTPSNSVIWLGIYLNNSATAATAAAKLRCMIRPASITDSTYEPYALPNPILTSALIEQVDAGAKNLCNVDDFPTTTAVWRQTTLGDGVTLPAGEYILSFTNITSDADGTLMQFIFAKDDSFSELTSNYYHITKGMNTSIKIRLTGDTGAIRIYSGSSYAGSQGKSLSFSGFMICSVEDYAVSPKYVPHRPSWQEMTDKNKIIDITSQITAESGYTVESMSHLYLQNNIVFGSIAIAKDSGSYSSSLTAVAKMPEKYAPSKQFINMCGFSAAQWDVTNIGYGFIQAQNATATSQRGQISVKSPTANMSHLIFQVNYPIQLDDTL